MDGDQADAEVRPIAAAEVRTPAEGGLDIDVDIDDEEDEIAAAPRAPKATPFGSVWDSQIGTPPAASGAGRAPIVDDEDFDEPEIPEYLIAEQRRGPARQGGSGGAGRGPRGGRAAYQSSGACVSRACPLPDDGRPPPSRSVPRGP